MSKIAYNKLGLSKMISKNPITIEFNDQDIEIQQYLPVEKKIELISSIVNSSLDDNPYFNPCRTDIYMITEIILAYTNISVTEKQKEDICKLYDSFVSSGLAALIVNNIPSVDYNFIYGSVNTTIQNIYKYKNSAMGLLENISTDYSNLNLDASEIQSKIADPENLELLKSVMSKLG
jgi:hypothetical protein